MNRIQLRRTLLAAAVRSFRAALHLFDGHIFLVGSYMPDMAERIDDGAHAIAVEFVRNRMLDGGAGADRLIESGVHVFHVDHNAHRRTVQRLRSFVPHIRVFIGQHDRRVANLDLRVPDPPLVLIRNSSMAPNALV